MMSVQPMLPFAEVPITCPTQAKYHAIAPCLAGAVEPKQQAKLLNLSYSTVSRWLKQFPEEGLAGLVPTVGHSRKPYTPERIIVSLVYFKCCVPKAADRELARIIASQTGYGLDPKTVKSLLERYFFWRYREFQKLIVYPILPDAQSRRREIVKLNKHGWSEQSITTLVKCHRSTVRKWLRRNIEEEKLRVPIHQQLLDYSHAPHQPHRKVYFGTIHTILNLQKKYPAAGWFRLRGYLLKDHGIELGETTLKKVLEMNRRLHLVPKFEKPVAEVEGREPPPRNRHPFEHAFIDIRYLDAKPGGVQLYSCLCCDNVEQAVEVHHELIRDHNRLPHFAHRRREDGKDSPLEVLGNSRGAKIDKTGLHQAFSRQVWQRRTNDKGFIRVGSWKIYIEEGLPKTPVELTYWDGKLRAEYRQEKLAEYDCRWDEKSRRPQSIEKPRHFETPYRSKQPELFEVG